MFNKNFVDDGIRTANVWCQKRPLCQPEFRLATRAIVPTDVNSMNKERNS